uniref:Peptidase S1 domain-containing protein n=1 Tax=Clastoptera arizonana TaxID=38151 RepID=A0A1B6D207_9HEMI
MGMSSKDMLHFKLSFIHLSLYIMIGTQALPLLPDQYYSIDTTNDNKKFLTALFHSDTHRFDCGERCSEIPILRPMKKDIFVSRSWSAGGMPFSVLYMKPKHPKNTRSPVAQPLQAGNDYEDKLKYEQYQPVRAQTQALTREQSGEVNLLPSRRQYSIIPQLFVSYGWGPLGK